MIFDFVLRFIWLEIQDTILDLIPKRVRKFIGWSLLVFGAVAILWVWFGDWDSGLGGIGGLIALFVGLGSIICGLIFLMHRRLDLFYWDESDDDPDGR